MTNTRHELVATPPPGEASVATPPTHGRDAAGRAIDFLSRTMMLWVLVIVVVVARTQYSRFFATSNLELLLVQNTQLGLVALGATFIIITGSFDLSVVAVYGFGAAVFSHVAEDHGFWPGLAAALAVGAVLGFINGWLVAKVQINSFVATLATSSVFGGALFVYTGSSPVRLTEAGPRLLAKHDVFGIPLLIVVLVISFAIGGFVLGRTVYGRSLMAVGGNRDAARLVGLPVVKLQISAFIVSSSFATLAGVVYASRIGSVSYNILQSEASLLLDGIAVVIVGGTSLFGGEGSVWKTAIGLAIFATLSNVFASLAIESSKAGIVKGLVLAVAVAVDAYSKRSPRTRRT